MIVEQVTIQSGPITVRCYAWGGHKNYYYQAIIGSKAEIAFFYEGKRRESRPLSAFEAKHLLELIGELRLPVADPGAGRTHILPTVPTRITVQGDGFKLSMTWTNSDSAEMPDVYEPFERLGDVLSDMLDINTDGLLLPRYL